MSDRHARSAVTARANRDGRFWDRVDTSAGPDACWPWMGKRQTGGRYGAFLRAGRNVYAHRRALELTLGRPLGSGMHVLHTCDNPPCCNPRHLFEGTNADNIRDRDAKGRYLALRRYPCPDCGAIVERIARRPGARCESCAAIATRAKRRRAYLAGPCQRRRVSA